MDIAGKIEEFIREKFEIDDDPEFSRDIHLFDSGFVDSLGAVIIVQFVESEFGIEITQKDITLYPMNTINEITAVVESKI